MFTNDHKLQLSQGLIDLQIETTQAMNEALLAFLETMLKWNHAYNLTAITESSAMVAQHLLDSLSIKPYLKGQHILDVGTGAGLPGIPLAIIFPNIQFTLLDALGKRCKFLQQVVYELSLKNVTIENARVENFAASTAYDQILTRAFASTATILNQCHHLLAPAGQFLCMKGVNYAKELEEIPDTYTIEGIHTLKIPGETAQRHLIVIESSHSG